MASPGRDSSRAATFSSSRMSWESASEHCRAIRTAICPIVLRQAEHAAQSLRSQDDVNAERPSLAHELFQEHSRVLGELVIFREEGLELVHDQHGAGSGSGR